MVGYVRHFFGCEGKKRLQQSKENGFYGKDPNSMYYIGFTKKIVSFFQTVQGIFLMQVRMAMLSKGM